MEYEKHFCLHDGEWIVKGDWPWQHFTPSELACHCGKHGPMNPHIVNIKAMNCLETLRNIYGPLRILSGFRCTPHNRSVGGATNSLHLGGRAFDISFDDLKVTSIGSLVRMVHHASLAGFTGFGIYEVSEFVHLDTGTPRVWEQAGSFFDDFNM